MEKGQKILVDHDARVLASEDISLRLFIYFERARACTPVDERERGREREREREKGTRGSQAGSVLSVQSPTRGSNSGTVRS